MSSPSPASPILHVEKLGFPWRTWDPFLFCVHHLDLYPAGNATFGPKASLAGRDLGNDFNIKDGWRMYHGTTVPGFPQHPHRGFETVTVTRSGLVDHSDSLGARARYGNGDVQWLTAGRGIVHAEMFPLLNQNGGNRAELFQIWLNLPAAHKMAEPYFSMMWNETVPVRDEVDRAGRHVKLRIIAGRIAQAQPKAPPPNSWAANPAHGVAIWTAQLEANAQWVLPPAAPGANRAVYFFEGQSLSLGGVSLSRGVVAKVAASEPLPLINGPVPAEFLVLEGVPIGEPVANYGPFVMNTTDQLRQAFADYQRTQFGGWPWPDHGPVHGPDQKRFAERGEGNFEYPSSS